MLPTDGATARPVGPRDDESCVQHGGRTPLQMGVVWRKCGFILGQPWMGIGEHPSMGIGEEEERAGLGRKRNERREKGDEEEREREKEK